MKSVKFSSQALKFIKKSDPKLKKRFKNKIDALLVGDVVGIFLHKPYHQHQKLRVGNYRIVYQMKGEVIYVVTIQHRSSVYEK